MTCAIYVRNAVEKNGGGRKGLLFQEKVVRQALGKRDKVYRVYKDNGCSGTGLNRPALNQMREDAKRKRFQSIMVKDASRLSRSLKDYVVLVDEFKRNGIALKSTTEDLSSPSGKFMANIPMILSDFDREMRGLRIKKAKNFHKRRRHAYAR